MAEGSFSDRTEQATPRRREEAKKKGQVPKSREIPSVMILMAGISCLFFIGAFMVRQLSALTVHLLKRVGTLSLQPANLQSLSWELIWNIILILSPILATVFVVSILSHYIQSGPIFSIEILKLDWSKISLLKGMGRVFSIQ